MIYLEKELKLSKNANEEKFLKAMISKSRIVAKALRFDFSEGNILCKLSDKVNAILPMSEVVVTELKSLCNSDSGSLFYPEIANIIGKNFSAIITSYNSYNSCFVISRRDSLIKSFEEIKKEEYIYCTVNSITSTNLFLDCGYGVPGTVYIKEASECKIKDLRDSFSVGDVIKCKIISINEEEKKFFLSRKAAIPSENIIFRENDIVFGKVREAFCDPTDSSGQKSFFFEILPYNVVGILNTFYYNGDLQYNDSLVCTISKVNYYNRYKLKIIKRL